MKRKGIFLLGILASLLLILLLFGSGTGQISASSAARQPQGPTTCSASFCLDWDVMAGSVAPMASSSFRIEGTLGQTMAGLFANDTYTVHAGFWQRLKRNYGINLPIILGN